MPRESSTSNHSGDAAINLSKSANTLTDNIPNDVPEDLTSKKPDKANGLDAKKPAISIFIPQSIVEQHSSGQNLLIRPCAPNPFEHPYNQANNHQAVPVDDLHSVDNDSEGTYLQHSPEDINDIDMMHRSHGYDKDEAKQLEQLEIFAKEFKQRRIKMGFTQGDVGQAMGCLYGNDFSQTTISRFEALNLSFKNMIKLKPLLERWLMDANNVLRESKDGHSVVIPPQTNLDPHTMSRKRKKRTSIDAKKRTTLDRRFLMNPKPSSEELQSIAEECDMEKEVVRVWFCNRRQKEKRISMHEQQVHDVELSSPDSPERILAPTTSYSVPWKFTEAECEPSISTVLRRPTPQNSNNELNPSATVKSFPHNRIKQESQKMAALPAVFGHGVLSNPNQTPILLSAAAAKSKGIQQAVSLHDHKLGPSPSGPNHLFQLNKLDSMAFNNRVQPNHGQSQSKTNNTSLPLPTTTVLNSLLNIGSTSFAMNTSHHTMPSVVNSCTNSDFTLDSKPGAAS